MISLDQFLALPTEDVARLVREAAPQVCVFPNDGTRRWFLLENTNKNAGDPFAEYIELSTHRHIDIYRLFFDHGIDTLLAPVFGGESLKRGDAYMERIAVDGLLCLAEHPEFIRFYDKYEVRVHFYGDYRKYLAGIPRADQLIKAFDTVSLRTRAHNRHRLLYGLFANNPTETIGQMAIHYYQETGKTPDHNKLVELYYGEYIEPASLFIGFEKFCAFDYPFLATGVEDLYFMVAPSSYLEQKQLRTILYDHLYTRRVNDPDYQSTTPQEFQWWKKYYTVNKEVILGTGVIKAGIWVPNSKLIFID